MVPDRGRARRGWDGQKKRREAEREVKMAAVALGKSQRELGVRPPEIARNLGVSERTDRDWQQRARFGLRARGRPLERGPEGSRAEVLAVLHEYGPLLGVPALRDCFPEMPRAELCDLLLKYRRVYVKENGQVVIRELSWPRSGAAWAADFADPPSPIEGQYPFLGAARDLGGQYQLAWRPAPSKEAWVSAGLAEEMIRQHGAPLVLKIDQGLDSGEMREMAARYGVELLVSPGYTPEYNGAIEAGIGGVKTRTGWLAAQAGRPGIWTANDAEGALLMANRTSHPWGELCPTPEAAWGGREPIRPEEREAFRALVAERRESLLQEMFYYYPGARIGPRDKEVAERRAIVQALTKLGYLKIRSRLRRVALKIKGPKSARALG
jgi:transposase InsO family protein